MMFFAEIVFCSLSKLLGGGLRCLPFPEASSSNLRCLEWNQGKSPVGQMCDGANIVRRPKNLRSRLPPVKMF